MRSKATAVNRAAGFTMIEVLVALLILSIGLLGLAGLHLSGMQGSYNGYLRSQAVAIANAMADRMRANMTGVRNGQYNNISITSSTTLSTPSCGLSSACTDSTGAGIAALDINQWGGYFTPASSAVLPGGSGTVSCANVGTNCTITVAWNEGAGRNTVAGTSSFTLNLEFQ